MKTLKMSIVLLIAAMAGFLFSPEQAVALLPSHDCSFCHDFHGGPGYSQLLTAESSELVCLTCHTVSINDTDAAEVHNPLGLSSDQPGYITCRECHDAHSNRGSNVKLVGYRKDAENWSESFTEPGIRKETPATVGLTYNVVTYTGTTDFFIADTAQVGPCEVCHSGNHNAGLDCTGCHGHSGGFIPSGGDCRSCHDGSGAPGTAKAVSVDSPHSTNTLNAAVGVAFTCENCHTDHSGGTVLIPNYNAVGISYGTGWISLGNSGGGLYNAAGATEAEICWNCHNSFIPEISEWGLNSDTNATGNNYDFGSLSGPIAPQWVSDDGLTGATWTSAEALFAYKTAAIQSTHSVNSSRTSPGLDPVTAIRCSYCHDVHELNALPNDNSSGPPYLRGSWGGNPYLEDGAPQASVSYASQGNFGQVPRGGTGATEIGGYQIDQNNDPNPTGKGGKTSLGWTADNSAGLCALCHSGTNVDNGPDRGTWASGDIDNIDQFTGVNNWVGSGGNGHSNAVLGGSGTNASNIFREDWRKPNDGYCDPATGTDADGIGAGNDSYCAGYPNMANQQFVTGSSVWAGSFRGAASLGDRGFRVEPVIGANQPFAYEDYNWGATVDTSTTDTQYHQFSCSKCHNPHASRLPRLMITNCLDISHNTWDDSDLTILSGDSITVAGADTSGKNGCDTAVNGTHTVTGVDIATNSIFVQSSSWSSSCSRQNVTITWNGTPYSLSSVDFDDGAGPGGTDEIVLNADIDMENFIGLQVHNTGTTNLHGTATVQTDNDGVMLTAATSAQNCHRYIDVNGDGDTLDAGDQKGWNSITPWVEP